MDAKQSSFIYSWSLSHILEEVLAAMGENFFEYFWETFFNFLRAKKLIFFKIAFFVKISWISPLVSRIFWCKGYWCGSTYMAVRLSDISSKMPKKIHFLPAFELMSVDSQAQNLSNFVPPVWKLHNPYCHTYQWA